MGLWANPPLEDAANEDGGSLWLGPHATKLVQHKSPVAHGTPPLGDTAARLATGLAPLWPPLTLGVQLWVVSLVNLLIIWNGLLVN